MYRIAQEVPNCTNKLPKLQYISSRTEFSSENLHESDQKKWKIRTETYDSALTARTAIFYNNKQLNPTDHKISYNCPYLVGEQMSSAHAKLC